jgi:polysaccharide export outer membrane protein
MLVRSLCLSLVFALCALTGCAGSNKPPAEQTEGNMVKINTWLNQQSQDLPAVPYKVQPPDEIQIHCPEVKEIDGHKFIVRSDGKIFAPLVGAVQVGNLTPAQISEVLALKLKNFYKSQSLDISVQVTEFKSKVLFVMGQVVKPGIKPFTGRDTVLGILADAKLNELAWPQKIVIVRRNDDPNVHERVTVDLNEMYTSGKLTHNYLLEEGDVIYVPPSPLAEAGLVFGKILFPVAPATNIAMLATTHI